MRLCKRRKRQTIFLFRDPQGRGQEKAGTPNCKTVFPWGGGGVEGKSRDQQGDTQVLAGTAYGLSFKLKDGYTKFYYFLQIYLYIKISLRLFCKPVSDLKDTNTRTPFRWRLKTNTF